MTRIQRLLLIPILFLFVSCQMAGNREAHRAQSLLDEAELLMEARELTKAKEYAQNALKKLENAKTLSKEADLDVQLLEVRAHFTYFMAENYLTFENAKVQRRSLVRFPDEGELVALETHLAPAERILKEVVASKKELSVDQKGFVHGMLGAILRLNRSTLSDADQEYRRAISAYSSQLSEVKANPPKIGSNEAKVGRLENQIRSLHMAQAEIKILEEEWSDALNRLQQAMGGEDLDYFSVQFEMLNNTIEDAQLQIQEAIRMRAGSREEALVKALEAKRNKRKSKTEELGSYNPYRMRLTQAKLVATDTVNNLIYRMICYHQLRQREKFERARQILDEFYPEIARDLEVQLRTYG